MIFQPPCSICIDIYKPIALNMANTRLNIPHENMAFDDEKPMKICNKWPTNTTNQALPGY
jgi:hypothetical protein